MTIDTFALQTEPDGTRFVYQAKDEMDKNHDIDDTIPANEGTMYENPGKI